MKEATRKLKNNLRPGFPVILEAPIQPPGKVGVWFVIIALWAIGWGSSTISAVFAIIQPGRTPSSVEDWRTAIIWSSGNLFEGFCVIVLTMVLIKYYARVSYADAGLAKSQFRDRYAQIWTVAAYLFLLLGSHWLSNASLFSPLSLAPDPAGTSAPQRRLLCRDGHAES